MTRRPCCSWRPSARSPAAGAGRARRQPHPHEPGPVRGHAQPACGSRATGARPGTRATPRRRDGLETVGAVRVILPLGPTVYLGGDGGLFVSDDFGRTWERLGVAGSPSSASCSRATPTSTPPCSSAPGGPAEVGRRRAQTFRAHRAARHAGDAARLARSGAGGGHRPRRPRVHRRRLELQRPAARGCPRAR